MPAMPVTLRWAVRLLWVETAALTAVAAAVLYQDVDGSAGSARGAAAVTMYTALVAAALAVLAWSLGHRRRWARGPAIVAQLLLLPVGFSMVSGGLIWLGLPVIMAGLFGAVTLLAPATRLALRQGRTA